MEPTFDAIVENWFLVTLCGDDGQMGKVLWGIVVEDRKLRFQPGHYVCTSKIIEEVGPALFRTRNTIYKCVGSGQKVSMRIEYLPTLRRGYSPPDIQHTVELLVEVPAWPPKSK